MPILCQIVYFKIKFLCIYNDYILYLCYNLAMKRAERLEIIEDIISNNIISTQEELKKLLVDRGIRVTQATLSRDVRKLNLIKKNDNGINHYSFLSTHNSTASFDLHQQFYNFVISISSIGALVVIRTHLGEAHFLANALDDEHENHSDILGTIVDADILGTIAGADTLLIICASEVDAVKVKTEIRTYTTFVADTH